MLALILAVLGQALFGTGLLGCGREPTGSKSGQQPEEHAELTVRADTKGLLFTWVDESGAFRITEKLEEIPAVARERVRVVSLTDRTASPDKVIVADLRQPAADGTFPTTSMRRTAWEELSASRRSTRLESLAPSATPQLSASPTSSAALASAGVTLYGARWCKACRDATRYLKSKGASVLDKDVDESPGVQAELHAKLLAAHLPPTSSIPVIEIGGQILVGFDPAAIDRALASLPRSKP